MSNAPKISVIFPCYHVLEFLDDLFRCIESQTFKDAEYIFVNDGDDSLDEKLSAFKLSYQGVKVLKIENSGVSTARNEGIKMAEGKWIAFCDPDDTFSPAYLANLYNGTADDIDMVFGGYYRVDERSIEKSTEKKDIPIDSPMKIGMDFDEGYPLLDNETAAVVWAKLYRKDFITTNRIYFHKDIRSGQDTIFNNELLSFANRISIAQQSEYYYYKRGGDSLQDLYKPNYLKALKLMQSSKIAFMKKRGWDEEKVKKMEIFFEHYVYMLSTFNLFKKNTPYSFWKAKAIIKQEIFDKGEDKAILRHTPSGLLEKSFSKSVATGSPFAVALTMKLLQSAAQNKLIREFLNR